jgi:hypothetical protein
MIPIGGFAPDADSTTPGVISDCVNFIPYDNGMEGGPSATTPANTPALAAECLGAAVVANLAGVRRLIAGTATKLYELSGGAWDDISRAAAYNANGDNRWSIAQFGNTTLASNKADTIQRSAGVGVDFADISGAPTADIIFTVGTQVMALNVNDGTDKPDGWHVCASNDETDWTPSISTLAARGRLVSVPGVLTAGARLGEFAVAYKNKAMYMGRFVGPPSIWDWVPVSGGDIGCVGKEAICDLGGVHFFVGDDNIFLFDGTRPVPVADGILSQWFNDNCNPSYRYRTKCVFDRRNKRVWVFFPSNSSTVCDSALVYHVGTKKWGRSDRSIEAALNFISSGLTYDTWSTAGSTYDTLPSGVSYDSPFWQAGSPALAAFNTSHQLQTLDAASTSSSFSTGDMGDDYAYSLLTGVRLRYAPSYAPATATVQTYHKANSGDSYTTGDSGSIADGKFDLHVEDRWHKATFSFTGQVRVTAGNPRVEPAGERE